MAKSGQARVPTPEQQRHLFQVIQDQRHPEKNTAIMQVSFKLGRASCAGDCTASNQRNRQT